MEWQTTASAALTVLSVAANALALAEIREGARQRGEGARTALSLAPQRALAWLGFRRPAHITAVAASVVGATSITADAFVTPGDLPDNVRRYVEQLRTQIAALTDTDRKHATRLAGLEERQAAAAARDDQREREARAAMGWVILATVLATAALLPQAFS